MVKDTQVELEKQGNLKVTPPPPEKSQPEPTADELKQENEQLKKQNTDKDRYITELSTDKATLETRLTQRDTPTAPLSDDTQAEAKKILEKAQDPDNLEEAGKNLAALIKKTTNATEQKILQNLQDNLQPAIERNVYVAEVKVKNKDLLEHFGEDVLANRVAKELQINKSITFKDAVDKVVKECREKLNKLKSDVAPEPPPKEAEGETGANKKPEPIPTPKIETQEDEIIRRRQERQDRGL